ncbi:MAG: NRDE family protein, partial [Thermoanaerobaculia bacterium]|nr:NRDE family protein [Thermoanaerobaculia bacterium]
MCLISLAWRADPRYTLVVAANRDEFHQRPTAPLARWGDQPSIIAGRDLEGNGTWMGTTTTGRFAAITNFREITPPPPEAPSRGTIVRDFLESDSTPQAWLRSLRARADQFAGFNLFVATRDELGFLSNRSESVRSLEPGVYGLSNGPWDANWPKVARAVEGMENALQSSSMENDLFALLRDEEGAPDEGLPDTGIGVERERFLSPIFILGKPYGTRSSTVLVVRSDGEVTVREKSWNSDGELVMAVNGMKVLDEASQPITLRDGANVRIDAAGMVYE